MTWGGWCFIAGMVAKGGGVNRRGVDLLGVDTLPEFNNEGGGFN